jgi:hypothetical protein
MTTRISEDPTVSDEEITTSCLLEFMMSFNILYSLRIGGKSVAGLSTERWLTPLAVAGTLSADIEDDARTSTSGFDVTFTCFSTSDESQSTVSVMVNYSTNINKANNYRSPQIFE